MQVSNAPMSAADKPTQIRVSRGICLHQKNHKTLQLGPNLFVGQKLQKHNVRDISHLAFRNPTPVKTLIQDARPYPVVIRF